MVFVVWLDGVFLDSLTFQYMFSVWNGAHINCMNKGFILFRFLSKTDKMLQKPLSHILHVYAGLMLSQHKY